MFTARRRGFVTLNAIFHFAVGIGIVAGIYIVMANSPFRNHGCGSPMNACRENLTRIEGAKAQLALETGLTKGATITWADSVYDDGTGYLEKVPREPRGASYVVNPIGYRPICTSGLPGHSLLDVGEVDLIGGNE